MSYVSSWKPALSWRVTEAEPSGMMMWFDPAREEPGVRVALPPDGEDLDSFYEGGALEGTSEGAEGVPCEGSAAKMSGEDSECLEDPPRDFLDSLWEGYDGEQV